MLSVRRERSGGDWDGANGTALPTVAALLIRGESCLQLLNCLAGQEGVYVSALESGVPTAKSG